VAAGEGDRVAGFNEGLGFQQSYYLATAADAPRHPRLTGEARADLCVVGGGCTGLSAALHAAERGLSVVLLEGGRVGWGASGRNGGQIIPGLRKGALELIAQYGLDEARALFDLALGARAVVLDLIDRHAIACDLKLTGHLAAAAKPGVLNHYAREAEALARLMDYPHIRQVSKADMAGEVASPHYYGGLIDELGGHYHPLNYSLGLARAAQAAGVAIYEGSVALRRSQTAAGVRVETAQGAVTAAKVVLAGDALLGPGLAPRLVRHIMPVANYIVATEPLENPADLICHDRAVSDSRFVVNYFRLTPEGRMVFGGGERYSAQPPRDIAEFAGRHLRRVFPRLAKTRIDYAWGGLVSITRTRLPHLGQLDGAENGGVYFAHGYSGLGAILSTLAGKLMSQAIVGDTAGFDRIAKIAPPSFPGGTLLRSPLHTLGMLWYAMRDRL
jgi:gamma-glutamylputrescine oxidase